MSSKVVAATPRWPRQLPFWLTLLLASAVAFALGRLVVRFQSHPFDGDEVNHALPSLMMAAAVRQNEWLEAAQIFYAQSFYPPAMAVFKAAVFLLLEPSFLYARLFSLASLFLAVLVLYAVCVEIDPVRGQVAGLIAGALTVMSRPVLVNATLSMVEMPGLLVCLLFLWAYVRVLKEPTRKRLLLASGLLIVVFLTKYTFGIVCLLTLLAAEMLTIWRTREREQTQVALRRFLRGRWRYLLGPFLLAMVLWFLAPAKIASFLSFTRPLPSDEPWLSLQNAGYYLQSIALHNLPSPLFAVVTGAALLWTLHRWQQETLRPLLLYFVIGVGMIMLVNHPPNARFIITFVPAAHVLTGLMAADLLAALNTGHRRQRAGLGLGLMVLLAGLSLPEAWQRWTQLGSLLEVMVETDPAVNEMAGWIQEQVPAGEPVYLVNYLDQLDANLLTWYRGLRNPADLRQPVESVVLEAPSESRLAATRQAILSSGARYLVLFEGGPWGYPFWPEYTAEVEDLLVPVARQSFSVRTYEAVQAWLDSGSVTEAEWPEVKYEERATLSMEVIIFAIEPAEAAYGQPSPFANASPEQSGISRGAAPVSRGILKVGTASEAQDGSHRSGSQETRPGGDTRRRSGDCPPSTTGGRPSATRGVLGSPLCRTEGS